LVLIALVMLHIGAIVYYRVAKRRDLVRPMVTGDKELASAIEPARDTGGSRLFALCLFLAILSGVWWGVQRLS
jgi:hypothetical protein